MTSHSAGGVGGEKSSPVAFPIPSKELGSVSISPSGSFEAGSYQTFTLVYTAQESLVSMTLGSMRICFRFASDQTRPQFEGSKGTKLYNHRRFRTNAATKLSL